MIFFVAEVSSNHNRDLDRSYSFIRTAAEVGCDAVKFQLFRINDLFAPEILAVSQEHRKRQAWELPEEFVPLLAQFCRRQNIQFGCTPFSLKAVDLLEPYVDFLKIASYELLWHELLRACAGTGKPVVLSTGMATLDEVQGAVDVLTASGCSDLTLLHCVSSYPVKATDCNLAAIDSLRKAFHCAVGWSDHSVCPAVIHRAVNRWSASMIELHLDLDRKGNEAATGHCWLPKPAKELISQVRLGLSADGCGLKTPLPAESADRNWRTDPGDGLRPLQPERRKWRRQPVSRNAGESFSRTKRQA